MRRRVGGRGRDGEREDFDACDVAGGEVQMLVVGRELGDEGEWHAMMHSPRVRTAIESGERSHFCVTVKRTSFSRS